MTFERYAIYFAPKISTRLARLGTDWLGRNTRGEDTAGFPAMDAAQKALVATPRRYGFHATLKAPFALRKGETLKGLKQAMARFAAQQQRIKAGPLHLTDMGRFLALTPDEPLDELNRLAALCVESFDRFRAPLTAAERARRKPANLSPLQREMLEQWGYPYVMDAFRFHMTLTGPLDETDKAHAAALLRPAISNLGAKPLKVSSICLFGDPGGGAPFRKIERYALA